MSQTLLRHSALSLLCLSTLGLAGVQAADTAREQTFKFKLEATGVPKTLGYMPAPVPLTTQKPARITKEPAYKGTPKYGVLHLGNGPKSEIVFAVDTPAEGDYKIYVDKNNNGDLTDDGDGAWSAKRDGTRAMYGVNHYVLRASYGSPTKETGSADYGVAFYQFVGQDRVLTYREGAAVGTIKTEGKEHKAVLVENDTDGVFSKPIDDDGKPLGNYKSVRPVWLLIDFNDDGKFANTPDTKEIFDARAPFKLGDTTYEPVVAVNGTELKLKPTTRVAYAPKAPERPKLLAGGLAAPDFNSQATDGHTVKLSDYKGKVLILDFWATWCVPCQHSLPHIQKVYQAVKDKNVAVLGLCVWDTKDEYDKWIPAHKDQYTFDFAFDPTAKDIPKSIASSLYKVSGIPTTYIIDKEGKVVDSIVGFSGDNDKRVEAALKKAGVEISE